MSLAEAFGDDGQTFGSVGTIVRAAVSWLLDAPKLQQDRVGSYTEEEALRMIFSQEDGEEEYHARDLDR